MRNLLTSFLDQRETIGNLLAPFLTGQPQQFQPAQQPAMQNMLLQGLEPSQKSVQPLPPPISIDPQKVAEVPRAVDPMQTAATPYTALQQQPQAKSGGFTDMLAKFGESDFGQRFNDMMLGWGMGGTMQDSLSKGSQMIAAGNQDRKAKKQVNQTVEWLKSQGMSEAEAQATASDRPALNAFLIALRKGVDPKEALQQRKLELEIKSLENPQLSPSDQLAREKFEWDKNNSGGDPFTLSEGQVRFDAQGNPIAHGGQKNDAPTVQKLKLDDGSEMAVQWNNQTQSWDPINAPLGGGNITPKTKLTESQSKLTLFQSMQTEAQPALLDLEKQFNPANLTDAAARSTPLAGNFFKSEQGQMYDAAATAWSEGALRIATGAAATPEEMERTRKAYFAQVGDTPTTIAFKAQMREMYNRAIERGLGNSPDGTLPNPTEFIKSLQNGNAAQTGNGRRTGTGVTWGVE